MTKNSVLDLSTRQHLVTVAERLLLESGYENVSVRAINAAAGMNPAAVHYHFGSKEALVTALLEDRLAPIWQDALAELDRRAGPPPAVIELVHVVVDPLARLAADPAGRLHLHLVARLVLARRQREWTSRWFGLTPWAGLLRTARPGLTQRQAARRWMYAFDLILQTLGTPLADTVEAKDVPASVRKALCAFVTAGLEAPVQAGSR